MKLRNKKTGNAVYVDFQIPLSNNNEELGYYSVTSLKELNESFEDYTPAEPLIKDEKIRKAVRAWAELHRVKRVFYHEYFYHNELAYIEGVEEDGESLGVDMDILTLPELKESECYTIAELCGEDDND